MHWPSFTTNTTCAGTTRVGQELCGSTVESALPAQLVERLYFVIGAARRLSGRSLRPPPTIFVNTAPLTSSLLVQRQRCTTSFESCSTCGFSSRVREFSRQALVFLRAHGRVVLTLAVA
jgi:hypothetical protein